MFDELQSLPADPILGLSRAFLSDPRPRKIDLGVGIYKDEHGRTPIMLAVAMAESRLHREEQSKAYLPPEGRPEFLAAVEQQLLGEAQLDRPRVRSVQTTGGSGALRLGADLLARARPSARVWMSTPTWGNHEPLLTAAGLGVAMYPYFDARTGMVDFEAMADVLERVPAGDAVLLHACCHNPTGADLHPRQWDALADIAVRRGWLPFFDMAYQGLGQGLEEDAYGLRRFAACLPEMLVANSFSKNYGLYRERAGSLTVLASSTEKARAVQSQLCQLARVNYSMPPFHGAGIVEAIQKDSSLDESWKAELSSMRSRIKQIRIRLSDACAARELGLRQTAISTQLGMFSLLDVLPEQVNRLRTDHGIYLLQSGRINLAGLSLDRVEDFAEALSAVMERRAAA